MGIFNEIPPTAGFRLHARDFLPLLPAEGRQASENRLESNFRHYLNVPYARVVSSGTAAFYVILESLKLLSARKTVIIPSYICPLIPLAIKRAGLKIEVCDINRDNFCYESSMLAELCRRNNDILAILAVHLAGLPADLDVIKEIAGEYGIFIIEDCAQALGASYKGSKAGTMGDFAFFSLGLGKGITTYAGGALIANSSELAQLVERSMQRFVKSSVLSESFLLFLLTGYWLFYRPSLFWFVFKLPQSFWRWRGYDLKAAMEDFTIDFPVRTVSPARQLIGHRQFERLDQEIEQQRQKAFFYFSGLREIKGLSLVGELPGSAATYPFVTVIFDSPEQRGKAVRAFAKTHLGASFVYALAVADYGYLTGIVPDRNCSNARSLSARTLTLSTSTFLTDDDLAATVEILKNL
jgi:perosamine synthetase